MKRRLGFFISLLLFCLVWGGSLNNDSHRVYARPSRVFDQRQMSYSNNRPVIDGDWYWKSSRAREWLHSTSTNPQFTNKGTVVRQTRGFLSDFTTAERNQIAITRRRTPVRHEWAGGLTYDERFGTTNFHGDDGLPAMRPFSMRYQGHASGHGDPMVHHDREEWRSTITHDKVFIPTAWELQRFVESRGWSMARGNTDGDGDTETGYWIAGTQTYTGNISRGVMVSPDGRIAHGRISTSNRGIVPMLHLKPGAAAGEGKRIGDTLTFGRYNSDNPEGHRGAITWRVVNEHNGFKLLMAEYAVDHFPYNVVPGGDPNNAAFAKSNYVNFSNFEISHVHQLPFQNTNASGTYINGRPEQPWFRVANPSEFHRRNTSGARFDIQGRDGSHNISRVWVGGNFVSGQFNRGNTSTSGSGPLTYRLSENDPGGMDTVITIQNNQNVFMSGHLPFNMIDRHVNLETNYDLPYNGYADNNQYVDVDVGLSNWNVNRVISRWHGRIPSQGQIAVFVPPAHTTYAGTRYRMSGRMRVTDWGTLHNALTSAQWTTRGMTHRSYSITLAQTSFLHDMYLPGSWYNGEGREGYDGSVGPVGSHLFLTWAQLRDAPGAGWVNFDTVMPVPQSWLSFTGMGLGLHATPNIITAGHTFPTIEIENWTFELVDDQQFKLQSLTLPNGQTINNPPVGSMHTHRVTATGNYAFKARDTRGYDWHTTANVKIDKTAPTGTVTQSPTSPTNGNVTITLDSRDNETGLAKVEYISGGHVQSQSIPSIDTSEFVQTHRSTFTVTQNGTYRFRLTDRVGNTREVTRTVSNIDRTPPTTSVTQTPTGWTNQNVTVNWTANAQGLSDLKRVRFYDGSSWSAWTSTSGRTQSFNQTVTSNRTVQFQVEDQAGNTTTRSHTVTNIDTDVPALSFTHSPSTWTNGNVTTTIRARDFGTINHYSGLHRWRFRQQGGTWSSWSNYGTETERSSAWFEQTRTITSNGTYEAQAQDRAGNVTTRAFTVDWIDKTAPNGTITGNPTSWTNQNVTLTFKATDTGGSGVRRVRQSGGSWVNGSTTSRTVSSNGTYSFEVEDNVGNTRTVSATVNRIDKTAPSGSISQNPTGWTNGNVTLTFTATDSGGSGVRRVRQSGGSWVNGSTTSRTVSENGSYSFEVEDHAGNTATRSITVTNIDKAAPALAFSHNPSTWTNGNVTTTIRARDFGFINHYSGLHRLRFRQQGGTWSSWSNYGTETERSTAWFEQTRTITSNGTYEAQVQDRAGNTSSQTFTVNWIDRTAPTVTSSQSPTGWTNGNVTITWSGSGTGSPIYRSRTHNGSSWSGWTTHNSASFSRTQTVSSNGTYRIQVEDQAGNIREITRTVSNIDKGSPAIRSSQSPTAWTNGNVTLTLEARDFGELNNQSTHISGIASIQVRRPNGTTWSDTYGTPSENSTSYYGRSFTATENGTYTVTVTDRAGNTATHNHTVSNIDRALPTGSTNRQTGWTNGNVWIDVTGRDVDAGLASIKYVSGGNVTGTTSYSFSGTTASQTVRFTATQNGTYTFDITDRAGNTRRVTQVVDNIDRTMPQGATTQTPTAWTNQNVVIRLTGGDLNNQGTRISGVDRVRMRPVGSDSWSETRNISDSTESSPNFGALNFTVTTNGRYQFELRDRAGNIRMVEHTVSNIDKGNPHIQSSQSPTAWTNGNVTLTLGARDYGELNNQNTHISGIASIQVRRPDGTVWNDTYGAPSEHSTVYHNRTFTATENGSYTVTVTDRAGNHATHQHTVSNIDRSTPSGSTTHMSDWTNGNVWIDVIGRDTTSGLASIKYISGGSIAGDTEYTFSGTTANQTVRFIATENATYTFEIRDRAGNTRRVTQTVSNIDRTKPDATTRLNPNSWTNQNVGIVVSGRDHNNEGSRISGVDRIRMRRAGASSWMETLTITDSTENSPVFSDRTFTVTENGTYEFELRDRAGNTTIVRQTVDKIDRTPPTASGTFSPNGWTNQNITITWESERAGTPSSPLRRYRTHNGTAWSAWQNVSNTNRMTVTQTVSQNGTYRFEIQDEAGNVRQASVEVTQYDNVAPVGYIRARFDRTEREVSDNVLTDVNMVDQERVTVDVFDVEDLGISGIAFIEIEEQRRIGSIDSMTGGSVGDWQTVETYRYDWPQPYDVSGQTYHIDVKQALDTRFVLVVQDRAGNRSEYATSNPVRHSVLQFDDLRITDVVNPELTEEEIEALRDVDLSLDSVPVTAGTDVTFELDYTLRHLDTVERVVGDIVVSVIDNTDTVTPITQIQIEESTTGHNQRRTVERTFRVPEGAPRDATIQIYGNLLVELENGTQHMIWYPNNDSIGSIIGSVDNHLEEFFRFRIIR